MRVRIIFNLKNRGALIPFHHQYLLSQLVSELLENAARDYSAFTYYSFSGLKGQTKVARAGLSFFSSKVTLVFSSPDELLVKDLLYHIFERDEIVLGQLRLVPDSVAREEEIRFAESSSKYVCISPIVLLAPQQDEHSKRFISPETDYFSDLLYESTMFRMEHSGHFSAAQIASFFKFQIVPDQQYLNRVREEEKKFARIYPVYEENRKLEIRGYTMPFTLHAEPVVQQFIFECGLGEMTHKGFGMLDLAHSEPHLRTQQIEVDTRRQVRRRENVVSGSGLPLEAAAVMRSKGDSPQ